MGISGDMTLGALLDLGADREEFTKNLSGLGIGGYRLEIGRKTTGGIVATDVNVILEEHEHGRHHHAHRHLPDILAIMEKSKLSPRVKETASRIFRRLAEAEATVHGCRPEDVHFHEVGAVDAIVDIVGSTILLELLGWPEVIASPMPTFHGYTKAAHGIIPLPAPATIELLHGVPWRKLDIEGELVTPTGAAIITEISSGFGHIPEMSVKKTGYGAGKKDFGQPNALRIMLGSRNDSSGAAPSVVSVIETNIDDMNPQMYESVLERLFTAGALDVYMTPIMMKKSRPGTLLSVICETGAAREMADIILTETSTFGVRISSLQRICLERRLEEIETKFGTIRVKIGEKNGSPQTASPEYDDCKTAAKKHGVPVKVVYETARAAFQKNKGSIA